MSDEFFELVRQFVEGCDRLGLEGMAVVRRTLAGPMGGMHIELRGKSEAWVRTERANHDPGDEDRGAVV